MKESEFDKFAEEYDLTLAKSTSFSGVPPSFFNEYKVATAARIARSRRTHIERILDFGSGVGSSLPFFLKYFPRPQLVCADVSRRCLEVSAKRFPGAAEYVEIQGRHIPVTDNSFDLVFSACVFHHIPIEERVAWIGELRRACRPGGLLIIFEHNPWNPFTMKVVHDCPFDSDVSLITGPQFHRLVLRGGWRDASIVYTLFFPHWLAGLRGAEKLLWFVPLGAQYAAVATAPHK